MGANQSPPSHYENKVKVCEAALKCKFHHANMKMLMEGDVSHVHHFSLASTHSLHQDKLCAADESSVDPRSFLSEHTDALLQPPLLHLRRDIVL